MLLAVAASSIHKWLRKTCLSSKQCATFIFITGRWQLLSQDATLIGNPVLNTTAEGGGGELVRLTSRPDPSPQWGWTIIEGTHKGRELRSRWRVHGAERICLRCLTFFIFFIDSCLSGPRYESEVFVRPAARRTQGGRRRINKLIKL